MHYLPYNISG